MIEFKQFVSISKFSGLMNARRQFLLWWQQQERSPKKRKKKVFWKNKIWRKRVEKVKRPGRAEQRGEGGFRGSTYRGWGKNRREKGWYWEEGVAVRAQKTSLWTVQSRAGSLGRGCQSVPETVHPGVQPEFTHSVCKIHVPQSALACRTAANTQKRENQCILLCNNIDESQTLKIILYESNQFEQIKTKSVRKSQVLLTHSPHKSQTSCK